MNRKYATGLPLFLGVGLLLISEIYYFHDIYGLAAVAFGLGIFAFRRSWKAIAIFTVFVGIGLYWSSLESKGCSAWWRGRFVADKVMGRLPQLGWQNIFTQVASIDRCLSNSDVARRLEKLSSISQDQVDGIAYEQIRTAVGDFWIADTGEDAKRVLSTMIREIFEIREYEGREDSVLGGGTVIDCGAHVGVFVRYALNNGAAQVIAIEPDPRNILCLRRNFSSEIEEGRVRIAEEGVWNVTSTLALNLPHDHSNTTARATVHEFQDGGIHAYDVPVRPLDDIVASLELERVDFIKMDIEGAERYALEGAQGTIQRFRPAMAICTYHLVDDPVAIPPLALAANSEYRINAKELDISWDEPHPKIMFFTP